MKFRLILQRGLLLAAMAAGGLASGAQGPRPQLPYAGPFRSGRPAEQRTDSVTPAQIDAAAKLWFDSDRETALLEIASRPYLSAEAQHYLVIKGVPSLTFDSSRLTVMLALVNTPHFLAEGKQAVLEHLELLTFDSSRKKVLEAINQRGHTPSERELLMLRPPFRRLPDLATLAQIDAAVKLVFDGGREEALSDIASQPYLSAEAQHYLVTKGVPSLTFESSRLTVMLALVNNPHFLAEGKQAVLEHLELLTFDSSRKKVLEAINQRGHTPSERETLMQRPPFRRLPDPATLAQIDAAIKLVFDGGREEALSGIASRPYLSAEAQHYLVTKGVPSLTFESSRLTVMLALVNNPHFLAEGKQAVLEHLELLTFDSSRKKVLEAINQRGHTPAESDFLREHYFPLPAEKEPQ